MSLRQVLQQLSGHQPYPGGTCSEALQGRKLSAFIADPLRASIANPLRASIVDPLRAFIADPPSSIHSEPSSPIHAESIPTPPPTKWWIESLGLLKDDRTILQTGRWLNDKHISAAQRLLQQQFPQIGSLQCPVLGVQLQFSSSVLHSESVQILNCSSHWICFSTIGCSPGHVNVYDSLYPTPPSSAVRLLCSLLHTQEPKLVVRMMDVQLQSGASDCGLFAIACALALCSGQNPCKITWTQGVMRTHLANCLSSHRLTPFPSASKPQQVSYEVKRTLEYPVFCDYRMPDNKRGMAKCSKCLEWFHQRCQKIPRLVFTKKVPWCCRSCTL